MRSAFSERCRAGAAVPLCWRGAAASAGITDTDEFIVNLFSRVTGALSELHDTAEGGRAQLLEVRSILHGAVDTRCDEIRADLDSVERYKVAALERELVDIDAALECWRAESLAVIEASPTIPDADFAVQETAMASRLNAMNAQLQALPTGVVEPPMRLLAEPSTVLSSIADFGRVLAPMRITAADVRLEAVPHFIRPGDALRLRLSLGARHASQSAEELEVSLGMLAIATQVEATMQGPGIEPRLLQWICTPDVSQRCLFVSPEAALSSPASHRASTSTHISAVTVAGQPVSGSASKTSMARAISAPLLLRYDSVVFHAFPCISLDGQLFCPQGKGSKVLVFDADGSPMPAFNAVSLGLSQNKCQAAYAHGDTPSLLLADFNGASSRLVAIDPATRAVRWMKAMDQVCNGITALPSLGVVVVGGAHGLLALRLSDGSCAGSLRIPGPNWFLASDSTTGVVYGSASSAAGVAVHSWFCTTGGPGAHVRISALGSVAAEELAEQSWRHRPIAVVPPAPGKRVSHLVIGSADLPKLFVLSLPSLAVVHLHRLAGMVPVGLAADPLGGALAVCDMTSKAIHVLPWPLPGMPRLQ